MSTVNHMHWYGDAATERFEIRVPKGFKRSLVKHLWYLNRAGRVKASQADFIIALASIAMAQECEEADLYFDKFFKKP